MSNPLIKVMAVKGLMKEASPVKPVINIGGIFDIFNHVPGSVVQTTALSQLSVNISY